MYGILKKSRFFYFFNHDFSIPGLVHLDFLYLFVHDFAVIMIVMIMLRALQVVTALNQLPLLETSLRVKGQWSDGSETEKSVPVRRQGGHQFNTMLIICYLMLILHIFILQMSATLSRLDLWLCRHVVTDCDVYVYFFSVIMYVFIVTLQLLFSADI